MQTAARLPHRCHRTAALPPHTAAATVTAPWAPAPSPQGCCARAPAGAGVAARSRHLRTACRSTGGPQQQPAPSPQTAEGDPAAAGGFVGLLPEEDPEVPGTYFDALNSNTKLGKAVKAAVEELEHLGGLEQGVLEQCDDLLKQIGMQGSLFGDRRSDDSNPLARLQQQLDEEQQLEEFAQQLQEEEEQEQQQQQQQQQQQGSSGVTSN